MKPCLFTVCAPWLAWSELLPLIASAGFTGVEIPFREPAKDTTQPPSFWGNNLAILDWDRWAEQVPTLSAQLKQHGLAAASLGSYADCRDLPRCIATAQAAQAIGAPTARVRMPWYDGSTHASTLLTQSRAAFHELARIGAAHGISFLVEMHPGGLCPSASAALRVIDGLPPEHVGVIFDPGNMLMEGNEAIPMAIDLLGAYLQHVHVKDATVQHVATTDAKRLLRIEAPHMPLGSGAVDWPAIVRRLNASGYNGWLSIKDFSSANNSPAAITRSATWLRQCLTPTFQTG